MKIPSVILVAGVGLLALATPDRARCAAVDASTLGGQFVDLLVKGDFAGATARYDAVMRAALPEPKLRAIWQTLQRQVGRFEKRRQTRLLKLGGYDVVLVTCKFEHATLDVKVVLNAKREVSGLFFVPSTAGAESTAPPAYVRTNAFHEEPFTVGRGEWRLPGTLTVPVGKGPKPWPAVVLVHGSGPNDRDETVGAIKPFRDLAWGLATRGIAVLRYEKRTKEYSARLARLLAARKLNLTVREETINDALEAVSQLRHTKGIDPKRIFVLGHSLGGTVAPRIGHADPRIAGLILMAGATRPLEDLVVEQTRYLLSLKGKMTEAEQAKLREVESKAARIRKLTAADATSPGLLLGAPAAYWLDLRAHNPVSEAKTLKQPMLILQGGRDYQVTPANFEDWEKGLGNSPTVTFKLYPDLNHLFVTGKGRSTPAEYEQPGHVAGKVVADIANWVLKQQ